jgi:TolB-like protein
MTTWRQFLLFTLLIITTLAAVLPAQIRLVVGEFRNQSDKFYLDSWQNTIPDLLQEKLSTAPGVEVLERKKLHTLLEEKALALSGLIDSSAAQEIGTLLQAEYVIFGSINEIDNRYRIDASLVKVSTGQILSQKVTGPDREQLSRMVDLLGHNLLFHLTGQGEYQERQKLSGYPTMYFLASSAGLLVATLLVGNAYQNYRDEYRDNTELDRFNELYDKANRTRKLSIGLASLTGTCLAGAVYCWIHNLSREEILAGKWPADRALPYLATNWKNEVKIGVQIRF